MKLENSIEAKVEISSCKVEFNFQIGHYWSFENFENLNSKVDSWFLSSIAFYGDEWLWYSVEIFKISLMKVDFWFLLWDLGNVTQEIIS